jgi:hypothetical protein
MPAFNALAASILRCQQAGDTRATDDRQRQLFAALEPGKTQIMGSASRQATAPRN